jgi:hypothetical protein
MKNSKNKNEECDEMILSENDLSELTNELQ